MAVVPFHNAVKHVICSSIFVEKHFMPSFSTKTVRYYISLTSQCGIPWIYRTSMYYLFKYWDIEIYKVDGLKWLIPLNVIGNVVTWKFSIAVSEWHSDHAFYKTLNWTGTVLQFDIPPTGSFSIAQGQCKPLRIDLLWKSKYFSKRH